MNTSKASGLRLSQPLSPYLVLSQSSCQNSYDHVTRADSVDDSLSRVVNLLWNMAVVRVLCAYCLILRCNVKIQPRWGRKLITKPPVAVEGRIESPHDWKALLMLLLLLHSHLSIPISSHYQQLALCRKRLILPISQRPTGLNKALYKLRHFQRPIFHRIMTRTLNPLPSHRM